MLIIEGTEANARIAHKTSEVIAIYPITPSSTMGEFTDEWSSRGKKNVWGIVPEVFEMQSEAGAAGTVHGALQTGALTTTFTSSQGLLLMIPNMYKIAGELTSSVLHVAARSLAAQGLSIFGDHSDVMSVRSTGYAMLSSACVQEVMDFSLISLAATLESRIPVLHFFDGFRTSHEISKIFEVNDDIISAMIDEETVRAHRKRAMSPENPFIRGTAQNPDVYFQGRESVNPYYNEMPEVLIKVMNRFAGLTGRQYHLFDYYGADDADRVIVMIGSGSEAVRETVDHLNARGEKLGVVRVHLYRPFSAKHLLAAVPATVQSIAVLDRCKEPGSDGEPLYKDVITAFAIESTASDSRFPKMPRIVGGRYGLSSKEFNPGMIKSIYEELKKETPKNQFTVGIFDDLTHSSLSWDNDFHVDANNDVTQCLFFGLGSDGTVSANKNSIKIIGEEEGYYVQGYFVYDSKKAGAATISHLRFGNKNIRSTYLIGEGQANFIACHQDMFLDRYDMLDFAAKDSVFLLNSTAHPEQVWNTLPRKIQQQIIDNNIQFYVINAYQVASDSGMGRRINTIMQTCFFAISGILPRDEAIAKIKSAVEKTYGKKGQQVVEKNFQAIDHSLEHLHQVKIPNEVSSSFERKAPVSKEAPQFIQDVTGVMIESKGDQLPVSMIPADGTWPSGSAAFEKRNLAPEIPIWEEDLCIHCGKCPFVCPHAAIRSKVFDSSLTENAPEGFKHVPVKGREFEKGIHISYQVAPEDCTGCSLCVDICPARDKKNPERKALNMKPHAKHLEEEKKNWDFFEQLPEYDRSKIRWSGMKGAMLAQPLFEFSGACVGCGETPYIRLATQLFGDRMLIANATGCSSIYGGNLPTTPYTTNADGRGPAWTNSLFEDNAEFGLGFRLSVDRQTEFAQLLLKRLHNSVGEDLVDGILNADQSDEPGIFEQRQRVDALKGMLPNIEGPDARNLEALSDYLLKRSIWIIGGDGWAYDIGFSGLDHVMASGQNVNILVLDTEVYSNTGGQMSKSTPAGAVAKFASGGKTMGKKDMPLIAMSYEHVYVATVAFGAKDVQTLRAFTEAEAYDGPSLIIAYSPCIAHGVDLTQCIQQQDLALKSGHIQLMRYDPRRTAQGKNPLQLDSRKPAIPFKDFAQTETRFSYLFRNNPEKAEAFMKQNEEAVQKRFAYYQALSKIPVNKD